MPRRTRTLALTLVVALRFGAAGAAEPHPLLPGLAGPDGREQVAAAAWPWNAIGRVNRGTHDRGQAGFCTGTLVAPTIVLTAAHCVINGRTFRPLPADALHFVAGWDRGRFLWHARATAIGLAPELADAADLRRIPHHLDWALLRLDPVPSGAQPIAIAATDRPGPVVQAGYSQDFAHVLTVDRTCMMAAAPDAAAAIVDGCSVTRGDSGSPLLIAEAGGYRLTGILAAVRRRGETWQAIAVPARAFRAAIARLAPPPPD